MWCSDTRLIDERTLNTASVTSKPLHKVFLARLCILYGICDSKVYGTYNGSLKAFHARFSITTTTIAIAAMSTVLKTRSGSHHRVYVTVFPLHLAIAPRGSGETI